MGATEIFQDDELTSTFNVQTEILEESLLGDQNDVEVPPKRKRVTRTVLLKYIDIYSNNKNKEMIKVIC